MSRPGHCTITSTTTTTAPPAICEAPDDPNGVYVAMQKAGSTVAWRLTCNRGFAVPPLDGNVAMCAKDGSIIPLNYCQEDSGCDGLKAVLALYKDAQPISTHNCKMSMSDGDTCRVQCPAGYSSVGFFACMAE